MMGCQVAPAQLFYDFSLDDQALSPPNGGGDDVFAPRCGDRQPAIRRPKAQNEQTRAQSSEFFNDIGASAT